MQPTTIDPQVRSAHALVLAGSAVLLGGALVSQHVFGLYPCDMCMWQRWPHVAALVIGTLALFLAGAPRRALVAAAALAVLISAGIGVWHAGVEYGWWESPLPCSADIMTGGDFLSDVMAAPLIRCDQPAWTLFGLSLAGYNPILSSLIGGAALWLLTRRNT